MLFGKKMSIVSLLFLTIFIISSNGGLSVDKTGANKLSSKVSLTFDSPSIISSKITLSEDPVEPAHAVNKRYVDDTVIQACNTEIPVRKYVIASNSSDAVSIDCGQGYGLSSCAIVHTNDGGVSMDEMLDDGIKDLQDGFYTPNPSITYSPCGISQIAKQNITVNFPGAVKVAILAICERGIAIEIQS
jgi:hypothetical protein